MLQCFEILSWFLSEAQKAARICFDVLKTAQDFIQGLKSDQDMLRCFEILSRFLPRFLKVARICFEVLKYHLEFYPWLKKQPGYASTFWNTIQDFIWGSKSHYDMLRYFKILFRFLPEIQKVARICFAILKLSSFFYLCSKCN